MNWGVSNNLNYEGHKAQKIYPETIDTNTWKFKSHVNSYLIKYFRQIQWVGISNGSVFPKLNYLLENFEHQGPMSLLLDEQ